MRERAMLAFIRTVFLIAITALVTIFIVQNLATIEIAFLTWAFAAPRALVFLLVFTAGVIVGLLLYALRPRRKRETASLPPTTPPPAQP
ncbi:MAG: DUF1049 domain-containing protein [Alphaproteobacteria bacterium]|nr:DUF1049 domain-containing protein [Alphaproteobacteria bacterium]